MTMILVLGACWLLLIVVVLAGWHRVARRRPQTVSQNRDRPPAPRSTSPRA